MLIGDTTDAAATTRTRGGPGTLPDSATVVGEETGLGQRNGNGDGIEHFGYVDGRSQPLFLTEDVEAERDARRHHQLGSGLPARPGPGRRPVRARPRRHFGSYFVFRKLEQNVRRSRRSRRLADELDLSGADRERAGAMLVGRFEDGTPLTLQNDDGIDGPVPNDFTYDSDLDGAKCPFHGHIRKTNPRGSGGPSHPPTSAAPDGPAWPDLRRPLRRPLRRAVPPHARPIDGVGLLFMAFNANINIQDDFGLSQFDFTQRVWANNPGFPQVPAGTPDPGLDPVIGQGPRPTQTYTTQWGGTRTQEVDAVAQAVRMLGGEYFFMPSLAFLRSL